MLLNFADEVNRFGHVEAFTRYAHGVVNLRQVVLLKLDIHYRADNFDHSPDSFAIRCHSMLLVIRRS